MSRAPGPAVRPAGFFALRTPLLPVEFLRAFTSGMEARAAYEAGNPDLGPAIARDRARSRERILAAAADPVIREAIFVASPSLEADLVQLQKEGGDDERRLKIEVAMSRYLTRMSARSSPFGLLAGMSTGTCGEMTSLDLPPRARYRRWARLDLDYLWEVTERLRADPDFRRTLTWRPNSSLFEVAGTLRLVAVQPHPEHAREHELVQVEATHHVRVALERARRGATVGELTAALLEADGEVDADEAEAFVLELIESQVLTSDFTPWMTGDPPAQRLIGEIRARPAFASIGAALERAEAALAALDPVPLGQPPETYRRIARELEALPAPSPAARLFRVDLHKPPVGASLGPRVMALIADAVALAERITPPMELPGLVEFRRAFAERYGQREVPLLEALDEETGIGFERARDPAAQAPLLDGLVFGRPASYEPTFGWDARPGVLLGLLDRALRSGATELSLGEDDLEALEVRPRPRWPGAFVVRGALADQDFLFHHLVGPPGGLLLGRFCHGDPTLEERVRTHAAEEETLDPEAIYAEVVHLSWGRLGNVTSRPALWGAEIPYLGASGVPLDRQIPAGDLMVSVEDGSIVLRSRSSGRRVVPRLSNAHNFRARSFLPVYRFLGTIQHQGVDSGRWMWGPLSGAPFLPRVRVGRIILSLARWTIPARRLEAVTAARGARRFAEVQRLRDELRLPRRVALPEDDEGLDTLELDLDDPLSVESLARAAGDGRPMKLHEVFPADDGLTARGPEGRYRHELMVPFTSGAPPPKPRSVAPGSRHPHRASPPGSEWLYARVYSGEIAADQVLARHLAPLAREAIERGDASRWFFIRYVDPHPHLRWRLRGAPERLCARTLPALHRAIEPLLAGGAVWRVELGTYEPELARYGGPEGMELAEEIFHADSDAAVGLLDAADGDDSARWRFALLGASRLLEDFQLSLLDRVDLLRLSKAELMSELPEGLAMEQQLAARYRPERKEVERLLSPKGLGQPELQDAAEVLRRRSARIAFPVTRLRALDREGRLEGPLAGLILSLLHMHVNRMCHTGARRQELVLVDFMLRAVESRLAREGRPLPRAPGVR